MWQNKLNLEDCCLTLEQATELKELEIDLSTSIFVICNETEEILCKDDILGSIGDNYTPTLTNTEMLEMLPYHVSYCRDEHGCYNIEYKKICSAPEFTYIGDLFRDVLFEMLRWLKQNKEM